MSAAVGQGTLGAADSARDCPYVGLIPFAEADAPYFFGRERDTEVIIANLTASRLTLLYASSGVGKSSVLRAGVIPQLREIDQDSFEDLGIPNAAVAYVRQWSGPARETVAARVLESLAHVHGARPVGDLPVSFDVAWVREVLDRSGVPALYLILDQFEEYFLYHPPEEDDSGLVGQVSEVLAARDLPVNILIAIREDALAGLDRFKGRVPHLFGNYLRLPNLGLDAARSAVEGPLQRYNELAPAGRRMSLEPEFTAALLDQVRAGRVVVGRDVPASDAPDPARQAQVETTYLQLVLMRIWNHELSVGSTCLRLETLEALGGAQTIVQRHLDEVMARLPPDQVEVAAAVFQHLVTRSGSKIALTAGDLADWVKLPTDRVRDLLETLCSGRQRILRPVAPPAGVAGVPRYEIYHDVMGAAVLDWRRRHVTERQQAETQHRLVEEREAAEQEARAAHRRLRRARLIAVAMAALLIATVTLAVYAYQTNRQTEQRALLREAAQTLESDPGRSLERAAAAYRLSADADAREALLTAASAPAGRTLLGGPGRERIIGLTATPDGRTIVAYDRSGGVFRLDADGSVVARGSVPDLEGEVTSAAASPDGATVALGTAQGVLAVVSPATGEHRTYQIGRGSLTVEWIGAAADGLLLVSSAAGVATYRASSGDVAAPISTSAYRAVVAADQRHVVTADTDQRIRIWDAYSGAKVAESAPFGQLVGLARADQAVVALETVDGSTLRLLRWDWRSEPQPVAHDLYYYANDVTELRVDDTAKTVAVSHDHTVSVYSSVDGRALSHLPDQQGFVFGSAVSSDGRWLATATDDSRTRLWSVGGDVNPAGPTYELSGQDGGLLAVRFLPGKDTVLTLGLDGLLRAWDVPTGERHPGDGGAVTGMDHTPDGALLVTAGPGGTIRVLDASGLARPARAELTTGDYLVGVQFDPRDAGRVLTLAKYGRSPSVWRWGEGGDGTAPTEQSFDGIPNPQAAHLRSASFTVDGSAVIGVASDGAVYTWDAGTGALLPARTLHGPGPAALSYAGAIAVDPRGEMIAVTTEDGTQLWRPGTAGPPPVLLPHSTVQQVAFDRSGGHLVTVSGGTLRIWNRDATLVREITARSSLVRSIGFDDRGELLVVGTAEGYVQVWDVETGMTVFLARRSGESINQIRFLPGTPHRLAFGDDKGVVEQFGCPACDDPDAVIDALLHQVGPGDRAVPGN